MKLQDALHRWADGSTCENLKGKFTRNANRRPLTNLLRHCPDAEIAVVACDHVPGDYEALVLVTPPEPKPILVSEGEAPPPKPPRRQPFYLFVG